MTEAISHEKLLTSKDLMGHVNAKLHLDDVLVYNAATGGRAICKNRDLVELGRRLTWDAPCSQIIWYPNCSMTSNWYVYYTMHLLFHMLPALFVDGLRKLSGRKPM
ncbi:hypothetical protein NQ317_002928 [Molorchus minor]|uniref:Uncharacterized protein n=1 Tax=Molorchus minor TaxID=1323400 RepID=A0ABQ9J692_9CUCU|nr:hypothetical protein NQ317_002928 [Molorchus minor]